MAERRDPLVQLILPQVDESHILMQTLGEGWTLPLIEMPPDADNSWRIYSRTMGLGEAAGFEINMLYCRYFEDQIPVRGVFVAEIRGAPDSPSTGMRWMSEDEIAALKLAHEHLRPLLDAYFGEAASGQVPVERPPWAAAGWRERAEGWIAQQLEMQGYRLNAPISQVRKWSITCVLHAPTDAGEVYFKAVPPTFAREVAVTRYLTQEYPKYIPKIIAYDPAERWLLLRDFGGRLLGDTADEAVWQRALRAYGDLQRSTADDLATLEGLGALDYRLEGLPQKLADLLADPVYLRPTERLSAEEIERLRGYWPRIKALCEELAGFGLAATLVHGDFHPWNIAVQEDDSPLFFDWTDASVGHPFLDTGQFFSTAAREIFSDQPDLVERLRTTYLSAFTDYAPLEDLQRAFALGEVLAHLHQAVNYYHLLKSIEPAERWSLDYVNHNLKWLLEKLETLRLVR